MLLSNHFHLPTISDREKQKTHTHIKKEQNIYTIFTYYISLGRA